MLILNAQLKAIDEAIFRNFINDVCRLLQESYPDFAKQFGNNLKPSIAKIGKIAHKYDIDVNEDTLEYILLACEYPVLQEDNFSGEIKDIMTWPNREGSEKIELLEDFLIE